MGEEELALQCKQANNRARKQLYEQYGGLLMAICLRYTGDKEAAEDVLHDGFIRIFQSIGQFSYQGEGSLRAWLSRVMVNEALGYLRKKNLQIQQNVIGESFRHGVKKLLFLGSTCIYPRDAEQPMKEDALLTSPLEYTNEPYAIAKIAGLKMCESFNLQYGTNYIAVMPTNLYGPNDNFDLERSHVLPAMIRKIHLAHCLKQGDWDAVRHDMNLRPVEGINGDSSKEDILNILRKYGISEEEVRLWGTGTPLREFLWSEEMADASVFVMEHVDFKDTFKPGDKEIRNCHINIGTGKEITIRQLAELIVNTVGYQGRLTFDTSKPDGTMRKLTDPGKLHALGWHHKIDIEEGVQRMYRWYLGK